MASAVGRDTLAGRGAAGAQRCCSCLAFGLCTHGTVVYLPVCSRLLASLFFQYAPNEYGEFKTLYAAIRTVERLLSEGEAFDDAVAQAYTFYAFGSGVLDKKEFADRMQGASRCVAVPRNGAGSRRGALLRLAVMIDPVACAAFL